MAQQKNSPIQSSLTSLFPARRIRKMARQCGAVQRQRKVDIVALVLSLVLGFATGRKRSLTAIRRAYEKATRNRIAPSAFYARFSRELVVLLRDLLAEALKKTAESSARATGRVLGKFTEVLAMDSTLIRLHSALEPFYPSVWTNHTKASAKLCMVMNVVSRGPKTIGRPQTFLPVPRKAFDRVHPVRGGGPEPEAQNPRPEGSSRYIGGRLTDHG